MGLTQDPKKVVPYVLKEQRPDTSDHVDGDAESRKDRERVTFQLGVFNLREYGVLQDLVKADGSVLSQGTYTRLVLKYGLKGWSAAPDAGVPPFVAEEGTGYPTDECLTAWKPAVRGELCGAIDRFNEFGEADAGKSQSP